MILDLLVSSSSVPELVGSEILTIRCLVCWNYLQLGIDPTSPPALDIINEKDEIEIEVIATAAKMEAITA